MPLPNRLVFAIGLAMLSVVALVLYMHLSAPTQGPEDVRADPISFELADTPEEQERGLSGRSEVPHRYAMLFVFPKAGRYGFWMKDMRVPIDIVWLDEAGVVTRIDAWVDPASYPTLYYPPVPTRYVIETRAGEAEALGWEEGSAIALPR